MQLMVLFVKRNCEYLIWSDLSEIGIRVKNEMEFHFWKFTSFRPNKYFGRKLVLMDTVNFKIRKLESYFFRTLKLTISIKSNFRPNYFSAEILQNMNSEKLFTRNRHPDSWFHPCWHLLFLHYELVYEKINCNSIVKWFWSVWVFSRDWYMFYRCENCISN